MSIRWPSHDHIGSDTPEAKDAPLWDKNKKPSSFMTFIDSFLMRSRMEVTIKPEGAQEDL